MRRTLPSTLALLLLAGESALAGEGRLVQPLFEARLRSELFSTPSASAVLDREYGFSVWRVRGGADLAWGKGWKLHGLLQAAGTTALPESAAFGSGQTYFATNGGDRTPEQVGLLELSLQWKSDRGGFVAGRQGFTEGAGLATGVAELDFLRTRRLAERLVGNLEFANVARRYDGVSGSAALGEAGVLDAFALRALAGAFHHEDALEPLDIEVYGAAFSGRHGAWIPHASLRLFAIGYDDSRRVARTVAGDDLEIRTCGGSLLAGEGAWSALGWFAFQQGDFGTRDHSASAFLLDAGWRFASAPGQPSLHFVWEQASGGGATGDSESFFNLLPTNHKYYGALDYSAFSNLRDLHLELRWNPTKPLAILAAVHDFSLVDRGGAWVGGSGAFSDRELGYAFRRPASGRFRSDSIGQELDLAATWTFPKQWQIKFEGGLFFGGAAAEDVLAVEADGSWVSLEATFKL